MSNLSKIHLLFIKEKSISADLSAEIESLGLQPFIDNLQSGGSLKVVLQSHVIGHTLPEGFILLSASSALSPFLKGLEESGQGEAVKRILPFQVPEGTAQAAINKYAFPAIIEYGEYFKYTQNGSKCGLIIRKDQKEEFEGEGTGLIGDAYRIEGQNLVKIITILTSK